MINRLSTVLGVVLAFAAVVVSHVIDHGSISQLINVPAFVIIFGGTIGATVAATSFEDLRVLIQGLRLAINPEIPELARTKGDLVDMARQARVSGVLSLETRAHELDDPYLAHGLLYVVDGMDPEEIVEQMQHERRALYKQEAAAGAFFETAGGFAPTFGIIGTVVGLIAVLSNMTDVAALAPSIAVAFTATLWGVLTANAFWLPVGMRLKKIAEERQLVREVQEAAVVSIARGDTSVKLDRQLSMLLAGRPEAARERKGRSEPAPAGSEAEEAGS